MYGEEFHFGQILNFKLSEGLNPQYIKEEEICTIWGLNEEVTTVSASPEPEYGTWPGQPSYLDHLIHPQVTTLRGWLC